MSLSNWGNPAKATCVGLTADHDAVYSVWELNDQGTLAVFNLKGQLINEHTLPGIPTNITLDACGHIFIPLQQLILQLRESCVSIKLCKMIILLL